ncbi:MAG: hypothetical protein QM564_00600 [Bergeyella sp.]
MTDLDILHFEQLKREIQARFLENHTPSEENISKWRGIDIIYFQEDLRKYAKGNISEKSFYTYFKSSPVAKLPRIDVLNLLSVYAGYGSWYEFKKSHLFIGEEVTETEQNGDENINFSENSPQDSITDDYTRFSSPENTVLQKNSNDNQVDSIKENYFKEEKKSNIQKNKKSITDYLWLGISAVLAMIAGFLGFQDKLMTQEYQYSFIDADRNSRINAELQVQILKDNESPILYTTKPNKPFVYTTKSKNLTMVVSSPYYKTDTIRRNLETAPEEENFELKPNDYAIMLYYYSKSIKDLKKKRKNLNYIINDNALIYQVYDSDDYGVETMDKQRYISLVTLPTTSLENLEVIETQNDKTSGKINMIKFRIKNDEKVQ